MYKLLCYNKTKCVHEGSDAFLRLDAVGVTGVGLAAWRSGWTVSVLDVLIHTPGGALGHWIEEGDLDLCICTYLKYVGCALSRVARLLSLFRVC